MSARGWRAVPTIDDRSLPQTSVGTTAAVRDAGAGRELIDRPGASPRLPVGGIAERLAGLERRRRGGGDGDALPGRGVAPWRADRLRVAKVPKPAIETFSPRAGASAMVANTAATALSAVALVMEVRVATLDASSVLFMVSPLAARSYTGAVRGCGSGCRVAGQRATVGRESAGVSRAARIRGVATS